MNDEMKSEFSLTCIVSRILRVLPTLIYKKVVDEVIKIGIKLVDLKKKSIDLPII